MNNDFISRSELKKAIDNAYKEYDGYDPHDLSRFAERVDEIIDNAPTVKINTNDIEYKAYCKGLEDGKKIARPQGEWIKITRKGTVPVEYVCSCCGRKIYDDYELSIPMSEFYPFCHCGAKMKGGAE